MLIIIIKSDLMMKVIISTLYEGKAVKVAINKLSPDKIILLADEPIDKTKEKSIKELKDFFKGILIIEILKTSVYDIAEIVEKVAKKIDEESKEDSEIIIHITEGRKITSLGLLFGGFLRKDKVKGAYYITEENNTILSLPLISFSLGETKKEILKQIEKGNGAAKDLKEKLEVNQSGVYQHLQELKKEGYISSSDEGLR